MQTIYVSPEAVKGDEPLRRRFWAKVDIQGPDECWNWTGYTNQDGYGKVYARPYWGKNKASAHRVAWVISGFELPDGVTIDHLCRNRKCANPSHMEVVPQSVNARRGNNHRYSETCDNGHAWTPENTKTKGAKQLRMCRECWRKSHRENMQRRRDKIKLAQQPHNVLGTS